MTRDEGVAIIKEQLAFKTTLDSNIVTLMQLAQTTLERSPPRPWFLESPVTSLVSVADNELIALPTGFITEMDEHPLFYVDSDGFKHALPKDDYATLAQTFKEVEADEPQAYALLHENIAIFPTPDAVYDFSWRFYKADTVLDTNVENNWLKEVPLLLLGSTGQLIAGGPIRDKVAMDIFTQWISTGMLIVTKHDAERGVAGRTMQMGGAHN